MVSREDVGPEAVKPPDDTKWHLAHAVEPRTLCGALVLYGSKRMLWSDTPAEGRCRICLQRLGV